MSTDTVAVCRLGGWDPSVARFVLDRNNPTAGVLVPVGRIDTRTPRQAGVLMMEALNKGLPGSPSPTQATHGLCQFWLEAYSIRHCVLWAAQRLTQRALSEIAHLTTEAGANLTLVVTDASQVTLDDLRTEEISQGVLLDELAATPTGQAVREHPRALGVSPAAAFDSALQAVSDVLRGHPTPPHEWLAGLSTADVVIRHAAAKAAGDVAGTHEGDRNAAHLGALAGAARHGWRWDLPDAIADLRCQPGHQYWPALRRYRSTQPAALVALVACGATPLEAVQMTSDQVTPDLVELERGQLAVIAPDAQAAIRAHLHNNAARRRTPVQFLAEYGRTVPLGGLVATARRSIEVLGADLLLEDQPAQ